MVQQQIIGTDGPLSEESIRKFISSGIGNLHLEGKRVLVLVPDNTRTMPLALVFEQMTRTLEKSVTALDFIVALGTHPQLNDSQLSNLFGQDVQQGKIGESTIFNHAWDDTASLTDIGTISAREIEALTGGRMKGSLRVSINHIIFNYDHLIICGPVFPHEVVGYSGGNKYFFPGISGPEIIDFTHWLGAILTNKAVIGSGYTAVRAVIDRAADFIDLPKSCFAFVVDKGGTWGIFLGTPEESWQSASALSAKFHIKKTGRTYEQVLSLLPEMYNDLWVGGKGMYKTEPVVADGGEVIIYAPHINVVSFSHGKMLREIGYHVCDYFLNQWDRFKNYSHCVLAHSTHVKGLGNYDAATGQESPRINVTLATGIPEDICRAINLGYRDPLTINPIDWMGREDESLLVVKDAGEQLYRVK